MIKIFLEKLKLITAFRPRNVFELLIGLLIFIFIIAFFIFRNQDKIEKLPAQLATVNILQEAKRISLQNDVSELNPQTRLSFNFGEVNRKTSQSLIDVYQYKKIDVDDAEFQNKIAKAFELEKIEYVDTPMQGRVIKFKSSLNDKQAGAILYAKQRKLDYYNYSTDNKKVSINKDDAPKICDEFISKIKINWGNYQYTESIILSGGEYSEWQPTSIDNAGSKQNYLVTYNIGINDIKVIKGVNNLVPNDITCMVNSNGQITSLKIDITGEILDSVAKVAINDKSIVSKNVMENKILLSDINGVLPVIEIKNVTIVNYQLAYLNYEDYLIPVYVINGTVDGYNARDRVSVRFLGEAIKSDYFNYANE